MTLFRRVAWTVFSIGMGLSIIGWGLESFGYHIVKKPTCIFDRNELGPMGSYGQWYWDVYKCADGTEQRELVAGPRG